MSIKRDKNLPTKIDAQSGDIKQTNRNYDKDRERKHDLLISYDCQDNSKSEQETYSFKPSTIMSLEDRDIIVIDKSDINESIKKESNVIVLDKNLKQEVDLLDLLGNNWPNTAGNVAMMLNKTENPSVPRTLRESQVNSPESNHNHHKSIPNPKSHMSKTVNPPSNENGSLNYSNLKRSVISSEHKVLASQSESSNYDNIPLTVLEFAGPDDSKNAKNKDTNNVLKNKSNPELTIKQDFASNMQIGIGSMVEVSIPESCKNVYGVVRWIGTPPGENSILVGIELEEEMYDQHFPVSNGNYNGVNLFQCNNGRAIFVASELCTLDRRFVDFDYIKNEKSVGENDSKMFGGIDCPTVAGSIAPLKFINLKELELICGKFKGIQGHHNSCYLDATLFAMFTFTSVFDSLLFRSGESEDIAHYGKVQKVLKEEIVNPLRKNLFVRADRVMNLRHLLDQLSSISGLTSEEKDPEEFLNSLLAQIMHVEPFLKLSSGQDSYFYQLFVEKDDRLSFPTVQQLFEQSFHSSNIKLTEVPSCLIIQMPRFGKNYKMYPRILPSQVLDITDIIANSPRQCSVCGKLADHECRDCFGNLQGGVFTGLESTAFCRKCLATVHMHVKRANHMPKQLTVPNDFKIMAEHLNVPRLYMELFAVVCIETSHYVAFVKTGSSPDAPWCFFDSMADRNGERNGYNIPEMRTVPDLPQWLSEEGARNINEISSNDKMLPEHAKRLFCDAYMCMYQSTDIMMYQ